MMINEELVDTDEDELSPHDRVSLCEALDRVLHKGVVVRGEVVLSVAQVDLVYLGLQLVLCSTDTALDAGLLHRVDAAPGSPA